jgi:hypothetical protein
MDEYWFCGIFPKKGISEESLTDKQKEIIEEEATKENIDNYQNGWLGYQVENGWKFMKHGQLVILIEEERGNIARIMLYEKIKLKYEEEPA